MRFPSILLLVGSLILSNGCEQKSEVHAHDDEHEAEEHSTDARFDPKRGLFLSEQTRNNLGVEIIEVSRKKMQSESEVQVQVHRSHESQTDSGEKISSAVASAYIDGEQRKLFDGKVRVTVFGENGFATTNLVFRIDAQSQPITERSELVVELNDRKKNFSIGEILEARIESEIERESVFIPWSSVLTTTDGRFVYVVNTEFLSRKTVKIGSRQNDLMEITEGLEAGETIVTKPVESLWLIELRLTKGGGHSH